MAVPAYAGLGLGAAWCSRRSFGALAQMLMRLREWQESRDDMYAAMKELDANKDGKIDREEFVTWFAKKALANY